MARVGIQGSRTDALLQAVFSLSDWADVHLTYIAYPRSRRCLSWPRPRTQSSLSQSRPRLFGIDRGFHRNLRFPSSRHRREYSAMLHPVFLKRRISASDHPHNMCKRYACSFESQVERRLKATSTSTARPLLRSVLCVIGVGL